MNSYEVEFQRISVVTVIVQAENHEAAEYAAWEELKTGDYDKTANANWLIQYVGKVPKD